MSALGRWAMVGGLLTLLVGMGGYLLTETDTPPTDAEVRSNLLATIRAAAPRERLEREIASALDRDAPEEAEEYLEVADLIGVPVDPALRRRWTEETSGWNATMRAAKRAALGFATGEGEDPVGVAAALASDLTVVGDVRDLAGEASKMAKGEAIDELTVGLSIAGVALTAGTVATMGSALPAKAGLSLTKLARRTGKLTAKFQAEMGGIVLRAVDIPAFRRAVAGIPWYRMDELAAAAGRHAARVDGAAIRRTMASLGEIGAATSPARTLSILRHVDGVTDLRNAERAAKLLGKPVSGALRLTGRALLGVAAGAVTLSMAAVGAIVAAVAGTLSFLIGALMALSILRRTARAVRWLFRNSVGRLFRSHPTPAR
ncbi:hypothetical protein [Azospirillum doebereinerae]|uniref:Uncharacterized protein n=1 Tax=Azospirillum doebereinerae TaxID=92933 RepID=A0A3S1CF43_9PROT|nr:hypothetical protein [Azospirillum doebereinerae]MCG5239736.1 hypothetical protein [Azospirillum doebereinerae]RUQ67131.1 hypothetical protein EJ913_20850 [Azospirillum doebereinerae]